jgi:hypothetical protein
MKTGKRRSEEAALGDILVPTRVSRVTELISPLFDMLLLELQSVGSFAPISDVHESDV